MRTDRPTRRSRRSCMATAESHVSAMQQQRSEHANIQSVTQLFRQRAGIDAQRTAARRKVSGRWQDVTWAQLAKEAEETGWGLIAIGVKRGDMVSIIAGTRVEWTVADLGVAAAGAITVPIYQSNTPDECQFILENAGAVMVFVEDQKQLAKLRQLRGRLPKIHHLVLLEGEGDGEWVLSLEQLNARGREHRGWAPRELEERIQSQTRNDLSTLLYTSGTTGVPKGVMITNDSMLFASEVAVGTRLLAREDSHLLFLPFAHSFAQIIKAAWFGSGITKFVSGGAPLAKKIAYFFDLLGFDMLEGYGLTETIAVTSVNLPGQNKLGTVGRPFPGVEVKIAEDCEILMRGRNIMRGYFGLPEATAEVIDKDGYFHTGDIGELDADGYLKITDRKKDLIKTSGGKYIAPQSIEGALKTASQLISQVVVIGDRRKYVSVLVTVVEAEAKKLSGASSYAEATRSPAVRQGVQEAIDRVNATLPSYETIKRFTILDRDFSQETGELTPTLKVKRKLATQRFKKEIDAMYDGESVE